MTGLTFRLREAPPERLDLSPLTPSRLDGLDRDAIARLVIGTTRFGVRVGDIFAVSGDEIADIRFDGGSTRFDRIGDGLAAGSIRVDGDVGGRLGLAMSGGSIVVAGSLTGPHGASAMSGGLIRVAGHAAEDTAALLAPGRPAMTGGLLIIGGRSGERLGYGMAGGLVLVAGGTDTLAGARMGGGTIVAASLGRRAGQAMSAGTLIAGDVVDIEPTFVRAGPADAARLAGIGRRVEAIAGPAFSRLVPAAAIRHIGDMAEAGVGELLVAET